MNTTNAVATPKVGDILVSSWGYDQTNVDFYKVIRTTPKSIVIRQIQGKTTEQGHMCGTSVPAQPHTFLDYNNEPLTKRFRPYNDGYAVTISSYASAYLWDGEPRYTSWYY